MKTISVVSQTTAMAEARAHKDGKQGIATVQRKVVGGVKYDTPQEVYAVQYEKGGLNGDTAVLYHHGTPTCEVWITAPEATVISVYGESKSDADSVNTFLSYFGISTRYTFKPVNGGFQEAN